MLDGVYLFDNGYLRLFVEVRDGKFMSEGRKFSKEDIIHFTRLTDSIPELDLRLKTLFTLLKYPNKSKKVLK